MATVYCGSCGAELSETAKFCRSCGESQEHSVTSAAVPASSAPARPDPLAPAPPLPPVTGGPPPPGYAPPPPPGPPPPAYLATRTSGTVSLAAALNLIGGVGICALALYALAYLPLRHDLAYVYDDLPRLCDLLTLATGLLATVLGVQLLRRAIANPARAGLALLALGVPALVLTGLAIFPDTFHIEVYPRPFYLGFNYLPDVLSTEVDYRYIPTPLVGSQIAVVLGGVAMLFAPHRATTAPDQR
jgi:hypothetical protein